jgi:aminopeptidase N
LTRFFERWIYGSGIPTVQVTSSVVGNEVLKVKLEQKGEVYDLPLTLTVNYADGTSEDILVVMTEAAVERSIPLKTGFRSLDVNKDNATLAEIEK